MSVDTEAMKLIKKLISYNKKNNWYNKAEEFLDVLQVNLFNNFRNIIAQNFLMILYQKNIKIFTKKLKTQKILSQLE